MIIYITETRNKHGKFYRQGDWGIKRPDNWDNGRDNWTEVKPPKDCLREASPVPCDWDDEEWVIDLKAKTLLDSKVDYEAKIEAKIREMAIADLGVELPDGYK